VPAERVVIGVQSLLFHTPVASIERMLAALDNAARIGLADDRCDAVVVTLGDGSAQRVLSDDDVARLSAAYPHLRTIRYHFFDANVGTSRGHNAMARLAGDEADAPTHLIFSNPDVVAEPRAIWRMLEVFDDPEVGFVEAKQLPIEHPKDFASGTGETGWATTAFAMTPASVFAELDGFDEESFFMYCDDVDYSWRVRESGRTVVYQAAAVVFHDKYLSIDGEWQPTGAEVRFSAQAALVLAHKWSRPGLVEKILTMYEDPAALEVHQEAAAWFRDKREKGTLPEPRDAERKIGVFRNSRYAEHRYPL
jgi:GT2 family glycosyltransferase